MAETRRKLDQDFNEGAVRLVRKAGRPVAEVAAEVRRLFAAHRGTYGSPRIIADLREAGRPCQSD